MTLAFKLSVDKVKRDYQVKCLGQSSFSSKVIVLTQRHIITSDQPAPVVGQDMTRMRYRLLYGPGSAAECSFFEF